MIQTAKISAIVPAYNRPHFLAEALHSLAEQEGSLFDEVIVTDDLGAAETAEVVRTSSLENLKYYPNPSRLGGVESWNRGLKLATGDWLTVLHEDDLLLPRFLATVRPHLRPGIAAVAVRCAQGPRFDPTRIKVSSGRTRIYPPEHFLKSAMTPFPGVVLARDCIEALGGFDAQWGPLADYEFWYRVAQYGKIEFIDTTAAFYRISDSQWTNQAWPQMLRRTLQLRRRIVREQFPAYPQLGKWLARFFTLRNGRSYFLRYGTGSLVEKRFRHLRRIPLNWLPSGWVWAALRWLTFWQRRGHSRSHSEFPARKFSSPPIEKNAESHA